MMKLLLAAKIKDSAIQQVVNIQMVLSRQWLQAAGLFFLQGPGHEPVRSWRVACANSLTAGKKSV